MLQEQILINGTGLHVLDLSFGQSSSVTIDHVTKVAFRVLGNVTYLTIVCSPASRPPENYEFNMDAIHHWSYKAQDAEYTQLRESEFAERDEAEKQAKAQYEARKNQAVASGPNPNYQADNTVLKPARLTVIQLGALAKALGYEPDEKHLVSYLQKAELL